MAWSEQDHLARVATSRTAAAAEARVAGGQLDESEEIPELISMEAQGAETTESRPETVGADQESLPVENTESACPEIERDERSAVDDPMEVTHEEPPTRVEAPVCNDTRLPALNHGVHDNPGDDPVVVAIDT